MHIEYILLNSFRKAKKGFTAGFHVPLIVSMFLSSYLCLVLEVSYYSLFHIF